MSKHPYTAIILGSGPAGYTCAIRLAQLGAKVAVVERDLVGGICINWGCTPSKAMIQSAKYAGLARKLGHFGIDTGPLHINFAQIAARRDEVMANSRREIRDLFEHYGIDLFQGEGEPLDAHTVRISHGRISADGTTMDCIGEFTEISGEHLVMATGSAPIKPGFVHKDDTVLYSNRLIRITELPEHLTVVGGGIIGLECATIFINLGSKVRVIDYMDRILNTFDEAVSTEMTRILEKQGVEILTSREVTHVGGGSISMKHRDTGKEETLDAPLSLIAIGRSAVINEEWCTRLGVEHTRRGITVNAQMQTTADNVWCIGDATGQSILAHVGMEQGMVCAESLMGQTRDMDYSIVPAVVYTLPEVSSVGTVPEDLTDIDIVQVPFTTNLRAEIEEKTDGFVKLWMKDHKLIAAQIVGSYASEIVQEYATLISEGIDVRRVADIIHAHPTHSEIAKTAFSALVGKSIEHIPDAHK